MKPKKTILTEDPMILWRSGECQIAEDMRQADKSRCLKCGVYFNNNFMRRHLQDCESQDQP